MSGFPDADDIEAHGVLFSYVKFVMIILPNDDPDAPTVPPGFAASDAKPDEDVVVLVEADVVPLFLFFHTMKATMATMKQKNIMLLLDIRRISSDI